jgi:SAM-dependent methyltransferase
MEKTDSLEDIIDFKYKCGHESASSFGKYADFFGLSETELTDLISNKKVLDLGSGKGDFVKECSLKGIKTDITSVNPRLALENARANEKSETQKIAEGDTQLAQKMQKDHDKGARSAFAQDLPFPNESFDLVFDVLGPSFYSNDENFRIVAKEMYRVTNKGGQIMIHADSLNKKTYILKQLGMPFKEINNESICINKPRG